MQGIIHPCRYLTLTVLFVNSLFFKRLEEIALSLIDWSDNLRCRHFTFILNKKRIIAIGYNSQKTHPANLKYRKFSTITGEDVSEHKRTCSEFSAIVKLKNLTNIDTKKCTLVNLRYDRNKKIAYAAPCMSCVSLLSFHEFKRVIWTDAAGKYVEN